jgi:hypothetical protein
LENVGQLRFLVHAEFVLFVVANRPRRQPFENYFDLVRGARIRALLGGRWKSAPEIRRQYDCERFKISRVEEPQDAHG